MLKEGDLICLLDNKKRKYIISLKKDGIFEFHKGKISHNDILKKDFGDKITSSLGEELIILKPTLISFILKKMKRISQIIYPKDVGQILILGDIHPGLKILECGTGSGALTCYLIRVICENGKLISIDERKEMIKTAEENIKNFYQKNIEEIKNLELRIQNLKDVEDKDFDRIILDLPNPWDYLFKIKEILKPGGILICWLPTVLQIYNLLEEIEKKFNEDFKLEGVYETLQREWQKSDKALRPKDKMIAHTGFSVIIYRLKH